MCEVLRSHLARLPSSTRPALICCGYPLNAPDKPDGADPKRSAHLLNLPAAVRVRLLQGANDSFNGPRGIAALTELVPRMAATAEVVEVPGGEHTLPQAKGLKALNRTQVVATPPERPKAWTCRAAPAPCAARHG
eukprot:5958247-Prymnesium_polylepis.1